MKTLLLVLSIALVLSGCGSSDSSSDSPSAKAVESKDKSNVATSYYVENDAALVNCDKSTLGYLAYVKSSGEFKACLEAGWTVVDVKGKNGSNGSNGRDGTMVSGNQWYDAVSQKMWVMTTALTTLAGFSASQSACISDNYRMPTPTEVQTALIHGMKATAQALTNAPSYIIASDGQAYTVSAGTLASPAQASQFCIAK